MGAPTGQSEVCAILSSFKRRHKKLHGWGGGQLLKIGLQSSKHGIFLAKNLLKLTNAPGIILTNRCSGFTPLFWLDPLLLGPMGGWQAS